MGYVLAHWLGWDMFEYLFVSEFGCDPDDWHWSSNIQRAKRFDTITQAQAFAETLQQETCIFPYELESAIH